MKKLFFILLGLAYYLLIQLTIVENTEKNTQTNTFSFMLHSKIPQQVTLYVGAGRVYIQSIQCDDQNISFPKRQWQWFETMGEQTSFFLKKGDTSCIASMQDAKYTLRPVVKQKLTFLNYGILFLLIGLPLFQFLFKGFIWALDKIKNKTKHENTFTIASKQKLQTTLPLSMLFILFLGIGIRILYFQKFGVMNFQHDWQGHIEFIKYIANHWNFPSPSHGLEYPQQPLYYLITASVYTIAIKLGFSMMETYTYIGYVSLFSSFVFLYYGSKFFVLMTENRWTQITSMLFLALTPSIVYLSARINNDALVMALASFSLYYIVKSYKSAFQIDFYKALVGVSLLFMTKISAVPLELLFFALLIFVYLQLNPEKQTTTLLSMQKKFYIFGVIGLFLIGFTLLRVYLPIENTFHMVNSSGSFPKQIIHTFNTSYFGTFNIDKLIHKGYSYIFGEDAIRYSFVTYQYGTMFFGEFGYSSFIKNHTILKEVMQSILLFGLVYILGFISYIARLFYASMLQKLLFATLLLNFLLILKFMFSYPVICNTDFRYFVPSFVLFAYIFSQGLTTISLNRWVKYLLSICIGMLAISEILFFGLLLT